MEVAVESHSAQRVNKRTSEQAMDGGRPDGVRVIQRGSERERSPLLHSVCDPSFLSSSSLDAIPRPVALVTQKPSTNRTYWSFPRLHGYDSTGTVRLQRGSNDGRGCRRWEPLHLSHAMNCPLTGWARSHGRFHPGLRRWRGWRGNLRRGRSALPYFLFLPPCVYSSNMAEHESEACEGVA